MTVWPGPGTVVVVLTAAAVLRSRQARAMAGYVMVSFAASMVELCGRKPAPRLREIQDLCYDNARAQVAADAAEAHNRETQARVEADEAEASAAARPNTSGDEIDGRREVQRIEFQTEAAQKRLEDVRERVERAKAVVEAKGGSVYYEPADGTWSDESPARAVKSLEQHLSTSIQFSVEEALKVVDDPDPDETNEPA